ncbi:MAG: helix-turn-helix domain-containing protein [Lachnospiraceae bacterium]|nr:helix-turn-helix domain-containing protein [Lachnospiraceae bacterium]
MTTGERIRYYREQKGMTLKKPGGKAGFRNSADVRIAQYGGGARVSKADTLVKTAEAPDVPVDALCCMETECIKCKSFRLEQLQEYRRTGKESGNNDGL